MAFKARVVLLLCCAIVSCATDKVDGLSQATSHREGSNAEQFVITASVNAFTPPGFLKPMVIARAGEIAKANSYVSFAIDDVSAAYSPASGVYSATANVRFFREPITQRAGRTYAVDTPPAFKLSIDPAQAARLAKLTGHASRNPTLWIVPVFVDAVSATTAPGGAPAASSYLDPGRQTLVIYMWLVPKPLGDARTRLIPIERQLEAGRSYRMTGAYNDGVVEAWLEDEASGERIGAVERVVF